jgi:toxin ParE1/3/4
VRIQWTEAAAGDLESIAAWIGPEDSDAAARQVLLVVDAVEELLPVHPAIGRAGRMTGTRELVVPKTPFIVAYRVRGDAVQVLRVLHEAMEWPR